MGTRFIGNALVALLVVFACGCGHKSGLALAPADSVPELKAGDKVTLYSIDGRAFADERLRLGELPEGTEGLHTYPVLGKVEIADGQRRGELISALKLSMEHGDKAAYCFWPRHAIRIDSNGKTTDYLLCFQCGRVEIHRESGSSSFLLGREDQAVFDGFLKDAGIPLAPH
jgi:hypothetical protein